VTLEAFDINGRRAGVIASGVFSQGRTAVLWTPAHWSVSGATPGVFWVRLRAEGWERWKKIVVLG
jgi:hypothetical protein